MRRSDVKSKSLIRGFLNTLAGEKTSLIPQQLGFSAALPFSIHRMKQEFRSRSVWAESKDGPYDT